VTDGLGRAAHTPTSPTSWDDVGLVELEGEVIRKFVPSFEWTTFDGPSRRHRPRKPLAKCRVALIGTAGAHLPRQAPIGPNGDIRIIPMDEPALVLSHPGYDTDRAAADPEVVFPRAVLSSLSDIGAVDSTASTALSTMGFCPDGQRLLNHTVPQVVDWLRHEQADLALLVPA
jgi:D-proline reductase (dithiol) PrdB